MNDICAYMPVDFDGPAGRWRFLTTALAKRLRESSKVLCVNRPICPIVTTFKHRKKLVRWMKRNDSIFNHVQQITDNLFVFTPIVLLHDQIAERIPPLVYLNRAILRHQLNVTLELLEFQRSGMTVFIYTPYQKDYIGIIEEKCLVYDCYDEYTATNSNSISRRRLKIICDNELEILKHADVVFTASETLSISKKQYHTNVHCVPNGVDIEHFEMAQNANTEIASDILKVPPPILGFTGRVTRRIDFKLVDKIAQLHPNWSIVFVGHVDQKNLKGCNEFESINQRDNVFFLGERDYQRLPNYLKAFGACILPYKLNRFNINSSPLKLFEYLAAGKPIISIDLPMVRPFDGLVRIAKDTEEFERQVIAALEEGSDELHQLQLKAAKDNSWERRADAVLSQLRN